MQARKVAAAQSPGHNWGDGESLPNYTAFLLAVVAAALVTWGTHKTGAQRTIESLYDYILKNGKMGTITPESAAYFRLPANDLRFKYITVQSESGTRKTVQIRPRLAANHLDVFFVEVIPGGNAAYFYYTDLKGRLLKAVYLDPEPKPVKNAEERFAHEIEFWQNKLKTAL